MKWGVITVRLPHLTDVPQVVTVVVAEREVVLDVNCIHISFTYLFLLSCFVYIHKTGNNALS